MASSKSLSKQNHSEQWWANHAPADMLRCTAHYKSNAAQCRQQAAPGTNVCNQHGALVPAVQARAAQRIQMSVDDAVKQLHTLLADPATENRDKIRILHDLLDRGGLGATSKHLVGVVGEQDKVEELFASILGDPQGLTSGTEEFPLDAEFEEYNRTGDDDPHIVDAEVVEEEPPRPRRSTPPPEPESASALPPPHILKDLKKFGLL